MIDLLCAFRNKEEPYCHGRLDHPADHLLRACTALFQRSQFQCSKWTEQHAVDFTETTFCTTIGCASSSKSNDYGLFSLLYWLCAPHETAVTLVSTTKGMLELRSFESVSRYFQILKRNRDFAIPGKVDKQAMAIVLDNDDMPEEFGSAITRKGSIRGLAIADGTDTEAETKLAGAHAPYFIYLLDELDGLRDVAMRARINMSIGTKDFRLYALTNPVSQHSWTSKYVAPLDGWPSVSVDTGKWENKFGRVRHHDGLKSPGIENPGQFPFLLNQARIADLMREEGEDSPGWWRMVRGFPAPQGMEATVLTPAMIAEHQMEPPAKQWVTQQFIWVAGLDPAFTSEGDDCRLQIGRVGMLGEGSFLPTLELTESLRIPIDAASVRTVSYQVLDNVRVMLTARGIPYANLAVDDSGTQSIADILDENLGVRVIRANFGMRASELPVSADSVAPAVDIYGNLVTELWMYMASLGRRGQLRGLTGLAAEEFCLRRLKLTAGAKRVLEGKKEFKKRLTGRRSPDAADAVSLCGMAARRVAGLVPGVRTISGIRMQQTPMSGMGTGQPRSVNRTPGTKYVDAV